MGKRIGVKGRGLPVPDEGSSPSYLVTHISISEDEDPPSGSPSGHSRASGSSPVAHDSHDSPHLSQPSSSHHSRGKSQTHSPNIRAQPTGAIPEAFTPTPKTINPYSLRARRATSDDLKELRAKYHIPSSVHLRVPYEDERPEYPISKGVALHIDLFDLGLRLPLQPFFMRMFS